MIVGILAFQGDISEHRAVLESLRQTPVEVREVKDLLPITHLIIPGGESTVMGRFLNISGLDREIIRRTKAGDLAIFGTCAGAILLARKVLGKNAPSPLGLMDIIVDRNAYGTQIDSFEDTIKVKGISSPVKVAFIRAPKITKVGKQIKVLSKHKGEPIVVQQGRVLASCCHPEARGQNQLHEYFLSL